jgi:hypothetical protein
MPMHSASHLPLPARPTLSLSELRQSGQHVVAHVDLATGSVTLLRRLLDDVTSQLIRQVRSPQRSTWIAAAPPFGPNGFPVDLRVGPLGVIGSFGGFEHEFEHVDIGMLWVARALSNEYRLKVTLIAGQPCAWRVEPVNLATSQPALASGQLSLRSLFAAKHCVYFQNTGFAAASRSAVDEQRNG